MKNAIKSYLVFTTGLYRIVTFLLVPLVAVILQWLIAPPNCSLVSFVNAVIFLSLEIMLDYWVFGGIAIKDTRQMEYLKTSSRGRRVMKRALIVNMARQFLVSAILFAVGIAFYLCRSNTVSRKDDSYFIVGTGILFLQYALIVTGSAIARHFDGAMVNMMIAAAAYVVLGVGIYFGSVYAYAMLVFSIVFAATASVAGVWKVMKRVEEGYYDQGV